MKENVDNKFMKKIIKVKDYILDENKCFSILIVCFLFLIITSFLSDLIFPFILENYDNTFLCFSNNFIDFIKDLSSEFSELIIVIFASGKIVESINNNTNLQNSEQNKKVENWENSIADTNRFAGRLVRKFKEDLPNELYYYLSPLEGIYLSTVRPPYDNGSLNFLDENDISIIKHNFKDYVDDVIEILKNKKIIEEDENDYKSKHNGKIFDYTCHKYVISKEKLIEMKEEESFKRGEDEP